MDISVQGCISEIRRVASLSNGVVTRKLFREQSRYKDSVWEAHFGTFEEFKRQAGLDPTRGQRAIQLQTGKHASVDHYRALAEERTQWAARYDRPAGGRFKTLLVASDLHDVEVDPFWLRVFLDTARRAQPEIVVLAGDVFDLAEFGKYTVDPREWDVVGRIRFVHDQILGPLRAACPDAQIDIIEGNHEARLLRHLADATPALRALLSDLHGWTIGRLLGLEQFEINYVAKADLAAWTKRDIEKELGNNYRIYWDALLVHHFPHARSMGLPGVNGHHHRHQVWSAFSPLHGPYEWHQLGAGHKRSASYTEGERWHNGFALVNVDTHTRAVSFDYVAVADFAVAGGQWYFRDTESVRP